jgi:hypothetical protein
MCYLIEEHLDGTFRLLVYDNNDNLLTKNIIGRFRPLISTDDGKECMPSKQLRNHESDWFPD